MIDPNSEFWRAFNEAVRAYRKELRDRMEVGFYETMPEYREAVGELKGLQKALEIGKSLFGAEPKSPLERLRESEQT